MRTLALLLALVPLPVLAQQQPDVAFLQKAITVLQTQRNQALDAQAQAQAQALLLDAEVIRLKAELEASKKEVQGTK